jgi:hypothetical protein
MLNLLYRQFWHEILRLKPGTLSELKKRCDERLETVHNYDEERIDRDATKISGKVANHAQWGARLSVMSLKEHIAVFLVPIALTTIYFGLFWFVWVAEDLTFV